MSQMNSFIKSALLAAVMLLAPVSVCMADVSLGRVKSVAAEAALFTLDTGKGAVLLVSWDKGTRWENLKGFAELASGDMLSVDYARSGETILAQKITRPQVAVPAGVTVFTLDVIAASLDNAGAKAPFTLIDVRPQDRFEAGHLAGAISVPLRRIEKRSAGILPEDRAARLVFYDEGAGDGSAGRGAGLAMKAGYANVAVFPEGVSGWERSGRFLASSNAFLRKGNAVIIDLRSPEKVASGHIERAVNIPAASFSSSFGMFPLQRQVSFVLYGESDAELLAAAKTLRQWGYRNVTFYPGGVGAWLDSAEVLSHEQVDTSIETSSTSKGGPLKPKDFELALGSSVAVEIVDVRSAAEQARGYLPNSRRIPLKELPARHGELDRDMIQVIFGEDAEQAEMAVDFLNQKGYRVNYLLGRVEFQGDGKYLVK